jgi:outer membrane protein assembly factor BamB
MTGRTRTVVVSLLACALALSVSAASAVPGADWPQYAGGPRHLGVNPTEDAFSQDNIDGLAVEWSGSYGANNASESSPVVANGVAYIVGIDAKLNAFDAAGCGADTCDPIWTGQMKNNVTGTPAIAKGVVYVGAASRRIYAFDAAGCGAPECEPLWKGKTKGAVVDSSMAVSGGVVYVGSYGGDDGGRLHAFDADGCGEEDLCQPLWSGLAKGHLVNSPAVDKDSVFIGSDNGKMYVYDADGCGKKNCDDVWHAKLGGPAFGIVPAIWKHKVYMGSGQNFGGVDGDHLQVFDANGCGKNACAPLFAMDVGTGNVGGAPAISGDTLYISSQTTPDPNTEGVVAAYDANGCGLDLCDPLWTGVNHASGFESSPAVAGGLVFVAKGPASGFPVDVGIYAFDADGCGGAETCDPLVFVQTANSAFYLGSSVAIAGGRVYFGANDNDANDSFLYALSVPSP